MQKSSASFSQSVRNRLRLKKLQAQAKNFCRVLDIRVEELMNAKSVPVPENKKADNVLDIVLKAVPLAMGVAVTVLSILDELPVTSGFTMIGIGLACVGAYLLKQK